MKCNPSFFWFFVVIVGKFNPPAQVFTHYHVLFMCAQKRMKQHYCHLPAVKPVSVLLYRFIHHEMEEKKRSKIYIILILKQK
jgi:hypothetical protein